VDNLASSVERIATEFTEKKEDKLGLGGEFCGEFYAGKVLGWFWFSKYKEVLL
jgi:hypothetical protein